MIATGSDNRVELKWMGAPVDLRSGDGSCAAETGPACGQTPQPCPEPGAESAPSTSLDLLARAATDDRLRIGPVLHSTLQDLLDNDELHVLERPRDVGEPGELNVRVDGASCGQPSAWHLMVTTQSLIVSARRGRQYTPDDSRAAALISLIGEARRKLDGAEPKPVMAPVIERRVEVRERILDLNRTLLRAADPQGVLDLVAAAVASVVRCDGVAIYEADEAADVLRCVVASGPWASAFLGDWPMNCGLTGIVVAQREAILANDVHLDPKAASIPGVPPMPESMIIVPLLSDGRVIGTLNVRRYGDRETHFSQDEFDEVRLFAEQASVGLEHAKRVGILRSQVGRDALTGIGDRGAFAARLDQLRTGPDGEPFALLLLDLDRFKLVNDVRGHVAGDVLLAAVAAAIAQCVRQADTTFRYGGDEFAVLLPAVSETTARRVANRIRRAVSALPPLEAIGRQSVSIGIAMCAGQTATPSEIIEAADRELYRDKRAHRQADLATIA
jgi:diguanylate cyclase (GGDEF)-like protein